MVTVKIKCHKYLTLKNMWLFISVTVSEVFSLNMLLAAQIHHIVDQVLHSHSL